MMLEKMLAKNLITETLLNSKLDTSIDKYNVLLWNIYIYTHGIVCSPR